MKNESKPSKKGATKDEKKLFKNKHYFWATVLLAYLAVVGVYYLVGPAQQLQFSPPTHHFDFQTLGDDVARLEVQVVGGDAVVDFLYGDGTQFTALGRSTDKLVAISMNRTIVFDQDTDKVFIASAGSESYLLEVSQIDTVDGVTLKDLATGAIICMDKQVGDQCVLGAVILTVESFDESQRIAELSIASGGSFYYIYDIDGNYMGLPSNVSSSIDYTIQVMDPSSAPLQTFYFTWESGVIVITSSLTETCQDFGFDGGVLGCTSFAGGVCTQFDVLKCYHQGTITELGEGSWYGYPSNQDNVGPINASWCVDPWYGNCTGHLIEFLTGPFAGQNDTVVGITNFGEESVWTGYVYPYLNADFTSQNGPYTASWDYRLYGQSYPVAYPSCGNNIREGAELCDGSQLGGYTCSSADSQWLGGNLGCTASCTFDATSCFPHLVGCTPATPCGIVACEQLNEVDQFSENGSFYLANDLDCTGKGVKVIGDDRSIYTYSREFNGVFDGRGHKITGLSYQYNPANTNWWADIRIALFKVIGPQGIVKNLTLENISVTGAVDVAAVAGQVKGTIQDVHVTGTVSGTWNVGGLAGQAIGATISQSSFEGTVSASSNKGTAAGVCIDSDIFFVGGSLPMVGTNQNCILTGWYNPVLVSTCMNITQPGHYLLTQDIVTDKTCFVISSSDVILDNNDFSVTCTATPSDPEAYGVFAQNVSRVVIKNMDFEDFYSGVVLQEVSHVAVDNNDITGSSASQYALGIMLYDADESSVSGNNISAYGAGYLKGIQLSLSSDNVIDSNSVDGVGIAVYLVADGQTSGNTVQYNSLCGSQTGIGGNNQPNSGSDNICSATYQWDDAGFTGCEFACAVPAVCTDSDGGIEVSVQGNLTTPVVPNTTLEDYCLNATSLIERHCSGVDPANFTVEIECLNGCSLGACNPGPSSCTDSDGGLNYLVAGNVTTSAVPNTTIEDYCLDSTTLIERHCLSTDPANFTMQSTCQYGCSVGACKSAPVFITNTTVNPGSPVNNDGSPQVTIINFTSILYPLIINFSLYDAGSTLINYTGPFTVNSDADLPWNYTIPGGLSNGQYTLNMTAVAPNGSTQTVTIATIQVTNPSTTGSNTGNNNNGGGRGSGGGGSSRPIIYYLGEIVDEEQASIYKEDKVIFEYKGIPYTVTVDRMTSTSITLGIESTALSADLSAGQAFRMDLNKDGISDISITLDNLKSAKAYLTFSAINTAGAAAVCGNRICESGEQTRCAADCPAVQQPNQPEQKILCDYDGVCSGDESTLTCASDCPRQGTDLWITWLLVLLALLLLLVILFGAYSHNKKKAHPLSPKLKPAVLALIAANATNAQMKSSLKDQGFTHRQVEDALYYSAAYRTLKQYVKQAVQNGATPTEIRKTLATSTWNPEVVGDVMKEFK